MFFSKKTVLCKFNNNVLKYNSLPILIIIKTLIFIFSSYVKKAFDYNIFLLIVQVMQNIDEPQDYAIIFITTSNLSWLTLKTIF